MAQQERYETIRRSGWQVNRKTLGGENVRRECYACGKELSVQEAVEGWKTLDEAGTEDFEGWVHCSGPSSVFAQPEDTELKEAIEEAGLTFYEKGILVCKSCVIKQWEADTGKKWIQLPLIKRHTESIGAYNRRKETLERRLGRELKRVPGRSGLR